MNTRTSPFAAAFAVLVALAALGCKGSDPPGPKSLTAVRTRTVATAPSGSAARYSATIAPNSKVDVAFKLGGYVRDVATVKGIDGKPRALQEGDPVTRGMQLASLRDADYAQKVAEAKASLAEAKASRDQAQLDFERATRLAGTQTISATEMDNARIKLDAARARLDAAQARVDEAETALGDTAIRAPMDGIVLKRAVEVGSFVGAGTVAFTIADVRSVKVVFGVPDTVVETLKLGSAQVITTEALRGVELTGHISRVAPFADAKSRVFEVEITVPNDKNELRIGMVAALKLAAVADDHPAVLLPLSAIVRSPKDASSFAVYVVDEGQPPSAHLREVELGDFLGNSIPVTKGLSPGEKVIVQGAQLVADGEQVQVIPEPQGGARAAR